MLENLKKFQLNYQNYNCCIEDIMEKFNNMKIPEWQRNYVWTDEQASRLIQSILLNLPVSSLVINYIFDYNNKDNHLVLIDGLQRLTSIKRFVNNEFSLVGVKQELLGLTNKDIDLMKTIKWKTIPVIDPKLQTEREMIEFFITINESGTVMSKEHLDSVKKLV
jgi:hypothetical protein